MKCKDCKYWDRDNIVPEGKVSWGQNIGGMADCLNKELDKSVDAKIISSDDAPTEKFFTSPNFGCIHFEDKKFSDLEKKLSDFHSDLQKKLFDHITYGEDDD